MTTPLFPNTESPHPRQCHRLPLFTALVFFWGCGIVRLPGAFSDWTGSRIDLDVPINESTLANGLRVVLNEDDRLPIVSLQLVYPVGSRDDSPGHEGLAHLFEHLMFRGSRHAHEGTFDSYLERVGGSFGQGITHDDHTTYYETVPSNRLEYALWLESDRMAFPLDRLDANTFEIERRIVEDELREQNHTQCAHVQNFIWSRLFPPGHPYHPGLQTEASLRRISLEEVRAFGENFYRPNGAILVVAGDLRAKEAHTAIEKYFGPIAPAPLPSHGPIPHVPEIGPTARQDIEANVTNGRVIMSWITAPYGQDGDAELDIIARMLERGGLATYLEADSEMASAVHAQQHSGKWASVFQLELVARPGVDAEKMITSADKVLVEVANHSLSMEFVRSMIFQDLLGMALRYEHPQARAGEMAIDAFSLGEAGFVRRNVWHHEAVTPLSVMGAAYRYLSPEHRLLTVVKPTTGAPTAGRLTRSR